MFGQGQRFRAAIVGGPPPKRSVTPAEYMLLVAAAAQTLAGAGKNPKPAQVVLARKLVDKKLAGGSTSSGSWSSGGFWSKVSKLAKQAGNAAVRLAPQAGKMLKSAAPIILPLAAGAIASPFLIKAISAASSSKQAKREAATAPPPPPTGDVVVVTETPAAEGTPPAEGSDAPAAGQPEGGLADIIGFAPYFEVVKKGGDLVASLATLKKSTKQHFEHGKDVHAVATAPDDVDDADEQEVAGAFCCGEEEAALACMGGSAEMSALRRRSSSSGPYADGWMRRWGSALRSKRMMAAARRGSSSGAEGIPIDNYRAAIWQRASKLSGGGTPTTKAIFAAEKSVKSDLAKNGLRVVIPGARPARETR
jgi:hypothetical protein